MIRLISTAILLSLLLAACGSKKNASTGTSSRSASASKKNACAGATAPGARLKFSLEKIVPCLNTTAKAQAFMANNVTLDPTYDTRVRGGNEYAPAPVVYRRGIDDADGYAILQCYFLEKNGFNAFMIGINVQTPVGSNVCAVKRAGGKIVVLGAAETMVAFRSFADIAARYAVNNPTQPHPTIRTLRASQVTKITTDRTTPNVLGLPWTLRRY
jgi:hypothetical protein